MGQQDEAGEEREEDERENDAIGLIRSDVPEGQSGYLSLRL